MNGVEGIMTNNISNSFPTKSLNTQDVPKPKSIEWVHAAKNLKRSYEALLKDHSKKNISRGSYPPSPYDLMALAYDSGELITDDFKKSYEAFLKNRPKENISEGSYPPSPYDLMALAYNHSILNTKGEAELRLYEDPFTDNDSTRDYSNVIDLDDEKIRHKFFSSNNTDEIGQNEYMGKYIVGKVLDEVFDELKNHFPDTNSTLSLRIGRKAGKPEITARTFMKMNKGICIANFLNSDVCKQYNVKAFTLLLPPEEKRGIRCKIDEKGARIYEVANGSYDMTLNWYVEGKECKMKININDDGSVKYIESNGVTWEQIAAHKEVKVGRQYEAKSLYEALSYLRKEKPEAVEVLQQPSTNLESLSLSQQHQPSSVQR